MDSIYYTEPSQAITELKKRQEDGLSREISNYFRTELGIDPPKIYDQGYAVLARHLPVIRRETLYATALSESMGVGLSIPSYLDDRFTTRSKEKMSLLKLFCDERQRGFRIVKGKQVTFFEKEKTKLRDIVIDDGESLYDYHLSKTREALSKREIDTFDISSYWGDMRAQDYYPYYLALFGATNILLEDFHGGESGGELDGFTRRVFEPAFRKVEQDLGIKPLIVSLPWKDDFANYVFDPNRADKIISEYREEIDSGD